MKAIFILSLLNAICATALITHEIDQAEINEIHLAARKAFYHFKELARAHEWDRLEHDLMYVPDLSSVSR